MRDLGRQYYPEQYETRSFIPELGVEIYKDGNRYQYDQIERGWSGIGGGGVSFSDRQDQNIVARGHMHWTNIRPSQPDIENAVHWAQGTPNYSAYVGAWWGWRLYFREGQVVDP